MRVCVTFDLSVLYMHDVDNGVFQWNVSDGAVNHAVTHTRTWTRTVSRSRG